MNRLVVRGIAVTAAAVLSLTACAPQPEPTTSITVYAASSLIKGFAAIGKAFQAANPGYTVQFVFASSAELSTALAAGAQADVFASGDHANMAAAAAAGALSGTPVPFAADRLVVVTAAGNPQHLVSLADLARPGVRVAVCAAPSGCGSATHALETRAGTQFRAATEEATSNRVVAAVTGGETDAGVVYTTDAQAAGDDVSWFPVPGDEDAVTSWISVVQGTDRSQEAAQFMAEVTGSDGRAILGREGFTQPLRNPAG